MATNKQAETTTKARVICAVDINGKRYEPDAVVEMTESELYIYRKSIDPHPDAVAHAEHVGRRARARRALLDDAALE